MIKHVLIGMKKRLLAPFVLMMMLLSQTIFPAKANTITIGSFDIDSFDVNFSSEITAIIDQINVEILFGKRVVDSSGNAGAMVGGVIFDTLVLTTDNVGQTHGISSGTELDEAVAFLISGMNDIFREQIIGDPGGAAGGDTSSEAHLIFASPTIAYGIDFAGYEIKAISLRVKSRILDPSRIESDSRDPDGEQLPTDPEFIATASANAVPEPATLWLFGAGLLGLLGISRRKKMASEPGSGLVRNFRPYRFESKVV